MKRVICCVFLLAAMSPPQACERQLPRLLAVQPEPDGVVFEMIAWEDRSWRWAAPLLRSCVDRLRARFPGLEFALISHGAEIFELARRAGLADAPEIRELAALNAEGMSVHVGGDYAQWKRLGQKDFLDFVDVTASGDSLLADYIELGFSHVRIEPPHAPD